MNEFFLIAKITSVTGDLGYLKVLPVVDDENRFLELKYVLIEIFGRMRTFFIDDFKYSRSPIIKFKNFNSSEAVSFLIGKDVYIESTNAVKLDESSFFIHDLIGCKVTRNDKFFGNVVDVLNLTSNDVLVIKNLENEVLIPFIKDYVLNVNISEQKIELVPGEDDLYEDAN